MSEGLPREIDGLRCTTCGASLAPDTPEVASVLCPSCGTVNRIAGEVLEALHGHSRAVGAEREEARRAGQHALNAQLSASLGNGWAVAFVISWLVAAVATMPQTPLGYAIATAVFLGPFGALVLVLARRRRRFEAEAAAARPREERLPVHCPTCGGQSELRPGQPVRPCLYCGGALAADDEARTALLELARASAVHERRLAIHQSWRLAAHRNRDPRTDLVPYFVIGGLASLWVVGALVTDVRALLSASGVVVLATGPEPRELLIINLIGLALVVGVATPLVLRRRRRQRWRAALDQLAAQTGATLCRDLAAFPEWLIEHWTGELRSTHICAGLDYGFIAASTPPLWALSIAPIAQDPGPVERHLRVLVPGREGSYLDARAEALAAAGFDCRLVDGGLVATSTSAKLDAIVGEPEQLAGLAALAGLTGETESGTA